MTQRTSKLPPGWLGMESYLDRETTKWFKVNVMLRSLSSRQLKERRFR